MAKLTTEIIITHGAQSMQWWIKNYCHRLAVNGVPFMVDIWCLKGWCIRQERQVTFVTFSFTLYTLLNASDFEKNSASHLESEKKRYAGV